MARRNRVKKQIGKDLCSSISRMARVGRSTAATGVSSGANSSSSRARSVITGTANDAATVVVAGANSSLLRERSVTTCTATHAATVVVPVADPSSLFERSVTTGTSVGVRQTGSSMTPAERAVVNSTGILPPSLAAGVDQSLGAGLALTRSDPVATIHHRVPSADSLKYEGSRLYKDEMGNWVADLVPENIAESDASSQMMGDRIDRPTPTMV